MHILLIEPDRVLAKSYASGLKAAGNTIAHTVDAQFAIQAADEKAPDVVVVSLELARHNGIEFLYEFRSYSEWQDIPAVLLTNAPSTELGQNNISHDQLGIVAVLIRTRTSVTDLVHTVERVAQRQGA